MVGWCPKMAEGELKPIGEDSSDKLIDVGAIFASLADDRCY
jgi:hypothetical protein